MNLLLFLLLIVVIHAIFCLTDRGIHERWQFNHGGGRESLEPFTQTQDSPLWMLDHVNLPIFPTILGKRPALLRWVWFRLATNVTITVIIPWFLALWFLPSWAAGLLSTFVIALNPFVIWLGVRVQGGGAWSSTHTTKSRLILWLSRILSWGLIWYGMTQLMLISGTRWALLRALIALVASFMISDFGRRWSVKYQEIPFEKTHNMESVLYLRSFKDDTDIKPIYMPDTDSPIRSMLWPRIRFEELVATTVSSSFGHLITVGGAGERLPLPGALRTYYTEDTWREGIRKTALECRAIIIVAGLTTSLQWEIQQLRKWGVLSKCLFLLPPDSPEQSTKRREILLHELMANDLQFAIEKETDVRREGAIVRTEDGSVSRCLVNGRHYLSYFWIVADFYGTIRGLQPDSDKLEPAPDIDLKTWVNRQMPPSRPPKRLVRAFQRMVIGNLSIASIDKLLSENQDSPEITCFLLGWKTTQILDQELGTPTQGLECIHQAIDRSAPLTYLWIDSMDPQPRSRFVVELAKQIVVTCADEKNGLSRDYRLNEAQYVNGLLHQSDIQYTDFRTLMEATYLLAETYSFCGEENDAISSYREAAELSERIGDPRQAAWSRIRATQLLMKHGDLSQAIQDITAAEQSIVGTTSKGSDGNRIPDDDAHYVYTMKAQIYQLEGYIGSALGALSTALDYAPDEGPNLFELLAPVQILCSNALSANEIVVQGYTVSPSDALDVNVALPLDSEVNSALLRSRHLAIALEWPLISTHFVLYGLSQAPLVQRTLEQLGIHTDEILSSVQELITGMKQEESEQDLVISLTATPPGSAYTPAVMKSMDKAVERATTLGHSTIEPGDLLWGLMQCEAGATGIVLEFSNDPETTANSLQMPKPPTMYIDHHEDDNDLVQRVFGNLLHEPTNAGNGL